MEKIIIIVGLLIMVGCNPVTYEQGKDLQKHETNLQAKEYIIMEEPEPEPEPEQEPEIVSEPEPEIVSEPEPEIISETESEKEPVQESEKRFNEIHNMEPEERKLLSQEEKEFYGVADDGTLYMGESTYMDK